MKSLDLLIKWINENAANYVVTIYRNDKRSLVRVKHIESGINLDSCCKRDLHTELATQKQLIEDLSL